jgi:cob(I)alamin adenosyltransferase
MSKFYTGTGDDGTTGLLGEGRVPKYHPIPEAVGVVDESTAALGLARSACQAEQSVKILLAVQRDLYHLMAELAATPENGWRRKPTASASWWRCRMSSFCPVIRQLAQPWLWRVRWSGGQSGG